MDQQLDRINERLTVLVWDAENDEQSSEEEKKTIQMIRKRKSTLPKRLIRSRNMS